MPIHIRQSVMAKAEQIVTQRHGMHAPDERTQLLRRPSTQCALESAPRQQRALDAGGEARHAGE